MSRVFSTVCVWVAFPSSIHGATDIPLSIGGRFLSKSEVVSQEAAERSNDGVEQNYISPTMSTTERASQDHILLVASPTYNNRATDGCHRCLVGSEQQEWLLLVDQQGSQQSDRLGQQSDRQEWLDQRDNRHSQERLGQSAYASREDGHQHCGRQQLFHQFLDHFSHEEELLPATIIPPASTTPITTLLKSTDQDLPVVKDFLPSTTTVSVRNGVNGELVSEFHVPRYSISPVRHLRQEVAKHFHIEDPQKIILLDGTKILSDVNQLPNHPGFNTNTTDDTGNKTGKSRIQTPIQVQLVFRSLKQDLGSILRDMRKDGDYNLAKKLSGASKQSKSYNVSDLPTKLLWFRKNQLYKHQYEKPILAMIESGARRLDKLEEGFEDIAHALGEAALPSPPGSPKRSSYASPAIALPSSFERSVHGGVHASLLAERSSQATMLARKEMLHKQHHFERQRELKMKAGLIDDIETVYDFLKSVEKLIIKSNPISGTAFYSHDGGTASQTQKPNTEGTGNSDSENSDSNSDSSDRPRVRDELHIPLRARQVEAVLEGDEIPARLGLRDIPLEQLKIFMEYDINTDDAVDGCDFEDDRIDEFNGGGVPSDYWTGAPAGNDIEDGEASSESPIATTSLGDSVATIEVVRSYPDGVSKVILSMVFYVRAPIRGSKNLDSKKICREYYPSESSLNGVVHSRHLLEVDLQEISVTVSHGHDERKRFFNLKDEDKIWILSNY